MIEFFDTDKNVRRQITFIGHIFNTRQLLFDVEHPWIFLSIVSAYKLPFAMS